MSGIKIILYGMSALLLAGCGQIVTESVSVPQAVPSTACAVNRKVVILPFADYSYADDMKAASQRNMAITEALTDELVARGFAVPVQEDTLRYLVAQNVIKSVDSELAARTSTVRSEMQSNWSDVMKDELRGVLAGEQQATDGGNADNSSQTPGTHGLDSKMISQIGRDFSARFVLRGRIIKYGMEKENTWEPMKKGLLPFVFDSATQVFYGFAKSDGYDTLGAMSLGYATGAMLGDSATNPYTIADRIDPSAANSVVWGAAGAGIGYLAKQGGETNQAAVQLRVWVQNAETGDVVWTNRVDVKVAPQSVFADNNPDALFQTAVNRAVTALIDDFWAKNELYL
jgi:hypothetical protein